MKATEIGRVVFLENMPIALNPLYTGGLFHCYMVGEFIFHIRG